MPEIPQRDDLEHEMARLFGELLARQVLWILEQLGDPPDASRVDWNKLLTVPEEQIEAIIALLERVFISSAAAVVDEVGIGVDWGLVNERAIQWAQQYTFELVPGINDTSRRIIRQALSTYFAEPFTLAELRERLAPTFGPVRAEMIAVTEITRASVQGELMVADLLRSQGIQTRAIWQTSNDEHVCPICAPRHNKPQGEGWSDPPPAHQRCRCWLNHEVI